MWRSFELETFCMPMSLPSGAQAPQEQDKDLLPLGIAIAAVSMFLASAFLFFSSATMA
jgi:hypothetical protein